MRICNDCFHVSSFSNFSIHPVECSLCIFLILVFCMYLFLFLYNHPYSPFYVFFFIFFLQDKHLVMIGDYEFLRPLFSKCSSNIFGSEHVKCILDYLTNNENGNRNLEDSSANLLLVIQCFLVDFHTLSSI